MQNHCTKPHSTFRLKATFQSYISTRTTGVWTISKRSLDLRSSLGYFLSMRQTLVILETKMTNKAKKCCKQRTFGWSGCRRESKERPEKMKRRLIRLLKLLKLTDLMTIHQMGTTTTCLLIQVPPASLSKLSNGPLHLLCPKALYANPMKKLSHPSTCVRPS